MEILSNNSNDNILKIYMDEILSNFKLYKKLPRFIEKNLHDLFKK